jgi:hypothetical protein
MNCILSNTPSPVERRNAKGGGRSGVLSDSNPIANAMLCDNCCKALQKPLVCAGCKTATYCSKDCQVTAHRTRGGVAIKASDGEAFACVCVYVCVCVCARVRMCTCVRHIHSLTHSVTFVFVCALD